MDRICVPRVSIKLLLPLMKGLLTLICLVFSIHTAFSQNIYSTGTWRDHLPYGKTIDVCEGEEGLIYCATPYGLFSYDQFDGDITRISKINYLSDVGLSALEYDEANKILIVGYENGNLDLIFPDNKKINLNDIKISSIIGDKKIYSILPANGYLYLATGIGVVVVDPVRLEVKETYFLGEGGSQTKINDIEFANDTLYAAISTGILKASSSEAFLANYANWEFEQNIPSAPLGVLDIEFFFNNMFINVTGENTDVIWRRQPNSSTWEVFAEYENMKYNEVWSNEEWLCLAGSGAYQVYHFELNQNLNGVGHAGVGVNANAVIMDNYGGCWTADNNDGLLWKNYSGAEAIIKPQGPEYAEARKISAYNDNIWIAHGGITPYWGNQWNDRSISSFVNEYWKEIPNVDGINSISRVRDYMDVAIDPIDNNHVYLGSWEEGLIEIQNNEIVGIYNNTNSPLQLAGFEWSPSWLGVAGVNFDAEGVLWYSNSHTDKAIQARARTGSFYSFDFSPTIGTNDKIGEILPSQSGYIWAVVEGRGLLAFNPNATLDIASDDNFKLLTEAEGNGKLPNKDVFCIKEDLDGEIWVGTLQGLSIFYNQEAVFSEDQFDSEPILIEQDGNVQELLGTEAITAIEVDGGNRKWIGTQNSGVFLFSDDGLQQIYHFTEENSPLLANNIIDIAINQRNGEVYFITERGIVSFFSTATNFETEITSVRAFPNPVREDYTGNITVDGLAYDTVVKITDIQGNVVFETTSEGGRAVWDGKTLLGERPATGVYLIYVSTPLGETDNVGKIAFIK